MFTLFSFRPLFPVGKLLGDMIGGLLVKHSTLSNRLGFSRSSSAVDKTKIGLRIGSDQIGSDWTGIFAFGAELLFEKS